MTAEQAEVLRGTVAGKRKYCRIPVRRRRATPQEAIQFVQQSLRELDELAWESGDEAERKEIFHAQRCLLTCLDALTRAERTSEGGKTHDAQ